MAKKAKSAARPSGKTSGPQKASGKATGKSAGKSTAKEKKAAVKQPSSGAVSGAKAKSTPARSTEAASGSAKTAKPAKSPVKSDVKTEPKSPTKPAMKFESKGAASVAKKPAGSGKSTERGAERGVQEKVSDKKTEKKPSAPVASAKKKSPDKPVKKAEAPDTGEELVDESFGAGNEDEFLAEDLEALGDPDLDANTDPADDLAGDDEEGEGQARPSALRKAIGRGRAPAAAKAVEADETADGDDADDAASSATAEKKVKRKDDLKIDRTGDLEQQWKTLFEKSKGIKPAAYKMSERYEARSPLVHKVLGWGYILTSQNDRLEVLFAEGIKFLISNRKS